MTIKTYKTYYNLARLTIWADDEGFGEANQRRPNLTFSFRDGNPRISVYTGKSGPSALITFPMDNVTFGSVIEAMSDVINLGPGTKRTIESLSYEWKDNKPTTNLVLKSTLYVGQTKEGVIYLSVIEEDKEKLVFPLQASKFHKYRDETGTENSKSDVSKLLAKGLVKVLSNIQARIIVDYTNEEYERGDRKPMSIKGYENLVSDTSSSMSSKLKESNDELLSELDI